ncbi:MAG: hypothetical protein LUE25_01105 [Clostridiales bacterium]|nr:hypothetical protein [Clostridiales bacterium]
MAMKRDGETAVLQNAAGHDIILVSKTSLTAEPNSITQLVSKNGGITRNYYDSNGNQTKQISNFDHGHPEQHRFGRHGEHAHDYTYNSNGKLNRSLGRELNEEEREENSDIL